MEHCIGHNDIFFIYIYKREIFGPHTAGKEPSQQFYLLSSQYCQILSNTRVNKILLTFVHVVKREKKIK